MMIYKPNKMVSYFFINMFTYLGIFLLLIFFNIIKINPRLFVEGYENNSQPIFFSEDSENDKAGTGWQRSEEHGRVNREIKEYYNNDFDENLGSSNIGGGYFCDLTGINKRLNYMQHAIDEIRGTANKAGKKLGVGKKLH